MPEEVEHITVKMPQSPALGRDALDGDLIWIWDSSLGKLTSTPVSSLPFSSGGGGGGGTLLGSPFKLRDSDSQVVIEEIGGVWRTTISDTRLLGKTDYPVSCTQLNNACFDDEYLTYDADEGSVIIEPFQLLPGKLLILYPDGVPGTGGGTGGSVAALQEQIDELKLILAPLLPTVSGANGGRMIWCKPAADIPTGWEEDILFRGRILMGEIPGDAAFGFGKTGGATSVTLTEEELPPHDHLLDERPTGGDWRTTGGSGTPITPGAGTPIRKTGKAGGYDPGTGTKIAKPFSVVNPYRIVEVIKYVGI